MTASNFQTPRFTVYNLEPDLISSLVHDKQLCATFIEEIEPEFFDNSDCRTLFKVIKTYFNLRHHVPSKDQTQSLIKKLELKSGVSSIGVPELLLKVFERKQFEQHELDHIKDELSRFIKTYKLRKAIAESIDNLSDEDKFPEIEEKVRNAVLWSVDDKLGTDIRDVQKRYLKIDDLFTKVIPTPWPKLNEIIGGGLFAKTLTIITASSSIGKSMILDNMALHWWKDLGLNVFIASLELSEEIKGMRIDSTFAEIQSTELNKNKDAVFKLYDAMGPRDNYLVIKEFPARAISSRTISNFCRKLALHKGAKPDIIIVDYMDILLPNSMKRMSLYEDGGDVSEQIRYLGYEFECPTVTASQLNKLATNLEIEKVDERFVAESQKKMNTADNLIAAGASLQQRQNGQLYLKSLKSRMGKKDYIVPMRVDYSILKIQEDD